MSFKEDIPLTRCKTQTNNVIVKGKHGITRVEQKVLADSKSAVENARIVREAQKGINRPWSDSE